MCVCLFVSRGVFGVVVSFFFLSYFPLRLERYCPQLECAFYSTPSAKARIQGDFTLNVTTGKAESNQVSPRGQRDLGQDSL